MPSSCSITPGGDRIAFTSYRNVTSIWRATNAGNTLLVSDESGNSNPQLSPDNARCRNLFVVEGLLPEGDRILSVEPDSRGIVFVKVEDYGSHLGMLVSSDHTPR